jgi:hypothetical protein
MSLDLRAMGQMSLLEQGPWRTMVSIESDHRLVVLCKAIPWEDLTEGVIPILYEEMVCFYVPARMFCGLLDSTESLNRTSIEEFRNRFGENGAQLITQDMLKVAKEFGFTEPDDVDMDTTTAECGDNPTWNFA